MSEIDKKDKRQAAYIITIIVLTITCLILLLILVFNRDYALGLKFENEGGISQSIELNLEKDEYSIEDFLNLSIFRDDKIKSVALTYLKEEYGLYALDTTILTAIDDIFKQSGYEVDNIEAQDEIYRNIISEYELISGLITRAKDYKPPFVLPGLKVNTSVPLKDDQPENGHVNVRVDSTFYGERIKICSIKDLEKSIVVDADTGYYPPSPAEMQLNRQQSIYLFENIQSDIEDVYVVTLNRSSDIQDPSDCIKIPIGIDVVKSEYNIDKAVNNDSKIESEEIEAKLGSNE